MLVVENKKRLPMLTAWAKRFFLCDKKKVVILLLIYVTLASCISVEVVDTEFDSQIQLAAFSVVSPEIDTFYVELQLSNTDKMFAMYGDSDFSDALVEIERNGKAVRLDTVPSRNGAFFMTKEAIGCQANDTLRLHVSWHGYELLAQTVVPHLKAYCKLESVEKIVSSYQTLPNGNALIDTSLVFSSSLYGTTESYVYYGAYAEPSGKRISINPEPIEIYTKEQNQHFDYWVVYTFMNVTSSEYDVGVSEPNRGYNYCVITGNADFKQYYSNFITSQKTTISELGSYKVLAFGNILGGLGSFSAIRIYTEQIDWDTIP